MARNCRNAPRFNGPPMPRNHFGGPPPPPGGRNNFARNNNNDTFNNNNGNFSGNNNIGNGGGNTGGFTGGNQGGRVICYKCGGLNHFSRDCKASGVKCYNCNLFGHLSRECPDGPRAQVCFKCQQEGHIVSFIFFRSDLFCMSELLGLIGKGRFTLRFDGLCFCESVTYVDVTCLPFFS